MGDENAPSPILLYGWGCGLKWPDRCQCGYGMLVDHLLLAISHKDDHKTVKPYNDTPELKAIHEKQRDGHSVFADLVKNGIL